MYPVQQEEVCRLDRIATAIALRGKGFDIDFEDWDGLSDESVLEIIIYLLDGSTSDMEEIVKELKYEV